MLTTTELLPGFEIMTERFTDLQWYHLVTLPANHFRDNLIYHMLFFHN